MDEHMQTAGDFLDGRHTKAAARIAALEAELAAERKRREAAEAILRDASNALEGHWLSLGVDAHFARYKD